MSVPPIVLYLHIPKAGGTTLSDWIYDQVRIASKKQFQVNEGRWLNAGVFYYPAGYVKDPCSRDIVTIERVLPRRDLSAVLGHFPFGIHKQLSRSFRYITMLRHPVERVLSLYHFAKLVEAKYGHHEGFRMASDTTLEEFVESPPFREVDNGQTRRISGLSAELGDCTKATLEHAKKNLREYFPVVGITERFDETLILLRRAFSWRKDLFYYPKNTNPDRVNVETLNKKTIDTILARNKFDTELYQFAAQLMDSAVSREGADFQTELAEFKLKKQAWYENIARCNNGPTMVK